MDNAIRNLKEFERGAWRQFNGKHEAAPFPVELDNLLNMVWESLSSRNQILVGDAADNFLTQQQKYQTARNYVASTQDYRGSGNDDDDAYGEESDRPDFADYAAGKKRLFAVLESVNNAAQTLREARRMLGLPNDDYGAKLLEILSRHYQDAFPTLQDEIDNLPNEQHAAMERLSERKRIAEGGLGPLWQGKWYLGGGTFGKANLFVKQDSSGRVADHVVIKDSIFKGIARQVWDLKEIWTDWKGPDDPSSIPTEIQAMYNLRDKVGSETIVRIRNWRIRRRDFFHRIYMEFCPGGDLFDFCSGSKNDPYWDGAARRELFPNHDLRTTVRLVPEPFLWSVFLSLAAAGLLMEKGTLYEDGVDDDWNLIVHRDLKISNVFLSWNSTDRFRGYPTCKVADFGLALLMPPDNDKVAENYSTHGTPGNRAPEQARAIPAGDGTTKMMSSKTNVWNIGVVIWSLIVCEEGLQPPYVEWENAQSKVLPQLDLTARLFYSEPLLSLLYRCLAYKDTDRPTCDELMDEIKEMTGDGPFDMASGLRDADTADARWANHTIIAAPATWTKDMMLQDVPHPQGGQYAAPPPPGIPLPQDDFGGATGAEIVPEAPATGQADWL
ncbi:uncharacterized protein RCC_03346 [Ramularia collo-cygni]|uniref:non-specific serine/threonine protein kinase n=1 Tax=Ramularia collo-cygni TaxID=112498 RepID=A0A2D3UNE5_9PEZI|nr:uncharacterized protein RCC_03346 [Ramularia collo-cygni]CZT17512.1 uncharacterized protein RCC_03346 [Ramularia collo-cygni]